MPVSLGRGLAASRRRRGVAPALLSLLLIACDVPTDLPRFESTFVVPGERLAVPVLAQPVSVSATHDLAEAADLASRARGGAVVVDVDNPAGARGQIALRISAGAVDVAATIDARGGDGQRVPLTGPQVQGLLGAIVTLRATTILCPAAGCGTAIPAGETVTLRSRYELTLVVGTED